MKKSTFTTCMAITIVMFSSIARIEADEVGEGAFMGATSGAIIGGAAGGGRGAGIGAGVGLGLGLISGGIAKSRRQKREQRMYQAQSLRREEYAHEELFGDTPSDIDEDDENEYVDTQVKTKKESSSTKNNATVDTASEDEEYKDEEVLPARNIETSYEDEI